MDIFPIKTSSSDIALSYDDPVPTKEDETASLDTSDNGRPLADRIGHAKVYLLSDASGSKSRAGKRRRDESDADDALQDVDMDDREESSTRENAILLRGSPIAHLPTSNIFVYATNFDAHPLGLEWVDDTTCVLVFDSKKDARDGFRRLQKSLAEEASLEDSTVTAKPIPIAIWPAEDRINATLGKSEGLKGILRMRWATLEDVKQRGARNQSKFYKKYGHSAGKTFEEGPPPMKRRRPENNSVSEAAERAKLDEELDDFLAEDEDAPPPSPPSRMRSDNIGTDGRTLLERTSVLRAHPTTLESRLMAPLPRRARSHERGGERAWDEGKFFMDTDDRPPERRPRGGRGNRDRARGKRAPRPRVTQEDLDAELDAFLNAKA